MSGRVVPAVTDHGLGGSGPFCSQLLAFPEATICSRVEADGIPPGACTHTLAPAPGCSLHPGGLVLRVWPRSRSNPKFSHSKPFSRPAQVGHAGFSLFLKGWRFCRSPGTLLVLYAGWFLQNLEQRQLPRAVRDMWGDRDDSEP